MKKGKISFKIYILVALITVLISAIAITISYRTYTGFITNDFKNSATSLSETVAAVLDTNILKAWRNDLLEVYQNIPEEEVYDSSYYGTPEYENYLSYYENIEEGNANYAYIREHLEKIFNANNVYCIYLVYLDKDNKRFLYLADKSDLQPVTGYLDKVYDVNLQLIDDPSIGFPAYTSNTPEYGWLASAGCPVYDEAGEIVAYALVDISMNDIMNQRYTFLLELILVVVFIVVLATLFIIAFINRNIVNPIKQMASAAETFITSGERGVDVFKNLKINTKDELQELADTMKGMEQEIEDYIVNITAITAEKERIGAELSVATKIQAAMLPNIFPPFPERDDFDIYASMNPAKEVGGDFYDFFLIDDTHLGLVIADVSGKGVPAALFMMMSKTLIKTQTQLTISPAEILTSVNNKLCENNDAEMFVTVWLGIIDLETGIITASNAGHEYPAIQRANGQFELLKDKHGFVVAGMENFKYKEYQIELSKGDSIFVYTDGVAEATNADNELFGTARMIDALNVEPDKHPKEILANVHRHVNEFVKDAPQFDDLTMLCIRYFGKDC